MSDQTITGWAYEFVTSEEPRVGGIVTKRGTIVGPGLETEQAARHELVARWGKDAEPARLRRMG